MNYEALIFDLDDTLIDTSRILIPIADSPSYADKIRGQIPLFQGARENLMILSQKYQLYLLTQGNPEIQKQKIKSAKISQFFKETVIIDSHLGESKEKFFKNFSAKHSGKFLSIGNRIDTDLLPAKKFGGDTCLFCYGEHSDQITKLEGPAPDYVIYSHDELITKVGL
ncbi:MAG: NIF family HAD-type phosphatase [Pseudobdellovibrionaceae bacterium]|jgi:FMN phosphatase YigB (HAD superfamily)